MHTIDHLVHVSLDDTAETYAMRAMIIARWVFSITLKAAVVTTLTSFIASLVEHAVVPCVLCSSSSACSVIVCTCILCGCSVTQQYKACCNVLAMTATLVVLMSESIYTHTRRNLYTHTHERYDNHTVLIQPAHLL
jgi:hypothetical protein